MVKIENNPKSCYSYARSKTQIKAHVSNILRKQSESSFSTPKHTEAENDVNI